ncbi:lysozyme [Streptomyces sp. TRM S81-3]|uniref:lysozyme n=1 Tax=Streptomyces griseicoloratus TaxID=2752516 RepID=A0A926L5U2_9ACTN|nr:lysozyme [Streptomyces griseicoloratus]MBD0420936.1 lysozyme [Streptomyces griseicoloratus]
MASDHIPSRRRGHLVAALAAALALGGTALAEAPAASAAGGRPQGHDVSSHQKTVDFRRAKARGATFVYVKATESHTYRNPYFGRQYTDSREAGLIRGAYHFALPDRSPGRTQARHFVRNGGGWTADGRTLPPALDIEYNPYDKKRKCYGLSGTAMTGWIRSFSDEVKRLTGRRPVIYTTTHWWNTCTGGSRAFAADHALWIARYDASAPGELPAGWSAWTFWQYDNAGSLPGDQNLFNGSPDRLRRFARGA